MLNAFLWGLLATSSLILGGLIASRFSLGKKTLGIIMAFGAGISLFSGASENWLSFIQAFTGRAILMVLANSMILNHMSTQKTYRYIHCPRFLYFSSHGHIGKYLKISIIRIKEYKKFKTA